MFWLRLCLETFRVGSAVMVMVQSRVSGGFIAAAFEAPATSKGWVFRQVRQC